MLPQVLNLGGAEVVSWVLLHQVFVCVCVVERVCVCLLMYVRIYEYIHA